MVLRGVSLSVLPFFFPSSRLLLACCPLTACINETKGIGSHARSLNSKVPASEVKCKEAKSLYIETRREF